MFGDRLKELREEKAISQRELARLLQLSPSTIAMYELDQRSPDKNTIIKIANLFNCTTDYILGESQFKKSANTEKITVKLPILSKIHPSLPLLSDENLTGYLDVPPSIEADYVLPVDNDSMIGVGLLKGDYAICLKVEEATSGQIVVFLEDKGIENTEAKLMFYYKRGNGPVLRPANPNCHEIHMTDNHHIVGIMVALIRHEAPDYQMYRDFLSIAGYEAWKEVIEAASLAGIKPGRLKSHVDMLIEMGKK